MMQDQPTLNQVNVVVQNMDATVAFYRRLGLEIDAESGATHVEVTFANGMLLEFDATTFVRQWDSGWTGSTGGSTVLGLGSRREQVSMRSTPISRKQRTALASGRMTLFGVLGMPLWKTLTAMVSVS